MCPEFSYSKGRILPSIEFILKEMNDFDQHFPEMTWNNYRMLDSLKIKALEKTVDFLNCVVAREKKKFAKETSGEILQ